ncbi:hypothetical protein I33_0572 [Bacillus subtilis subsp. subtilis str. RO-NN-1]|nr:hypothetical protein I33_0572 [Bacillus subtilis subsp. subtilis str. RO-NN-1]
MSLKRKQNKNTPEFWCVSKMISIKWKSSIFSYKSTSF